MSEARRPAAPFGAAAGPLAIGSVLVAVTPIVVATVRALLRDWLPVGENALFQIRAHDVFSAHPPLIGLASSASESTRVDLHHPGPLLFDLLAVPVALFQGPGVALGIGALNVLAVLGVAWVVYRIAGPLFVTIAMAVTTVLTWTLGSEVLFDPWNPHSMLLPFWCALFLAWGVATGDVILFPILVAAGSLILQTHLSYTFLIPALLAFAIAGFFWSQRRSTAESRVPKRRVAWVGAVALGVVALAWAQPLADQFFGDGPGNLGALVSSAGDSDDPAVGYADAPRLVATVATLPPFWFRSSFHDGWLETPGAIQATPDLPSSAASLVTLAMLAGLLVLCALDARRRRDRRLGLLVVLASGALLVALFTSAQAPLGFFGLPLHFFRWLWALAAFATFAIVATIVARVATNASRAAWVAGGAVTIAVVFALLNLPSSNQAVAPPLYGIPVMRDVNGQLDEVEDAGTVYVDIPQRFNDPYGPAVLAELQRRGVPFRVGKDWARQVGERRLFDGTNADSVLLVRTGDNALEAPRGTEEIAFHEGLTPSERRELDQLKEQIAQRIAADGIHLNAKARAEIDDTQLRRFRDALAQDPIDPGPLLRLRAVVGLVEYDFLEPDDFTPRYERYAYLQDRSDRRTLGLFLQPASTWRS